METLLWLLNIYALILLVRALMSWFDPGFRSQVGQIIFKLTEPVVGPIRQVMPSTGGLDFSVMIAIFLIYILRSIIAQSMV